MSLKSTANEGGLVFLSLEPWDQIWRRNQFVCSELARRNPQAQIVFVEPPADVSNAIRTGRLSQLWSSFPNRTAGTSNITLTRAQKWLPNTVSVCHKFNVRLYQSHVSKVIRELGLRDYFLWINDHAFEAVVGRLGEAASIYDITDDWIAFEQPQRLRKRIIKQDARLCSKTDATIVCSQRLWEMKRSVSSNLHLVPNGVDTAYYSDVSNRSLPVPLESIDWPRPVLGYTGTVHPDRVDLDLLEDLANLWPGTIILVGPNHLPSQTTEKLTRLTNVVLVGPKPYTEITQWMRAFDVCITPHRVTEFTESLNPIKLWEYLASGKPIVSTPVAGFRDYKNLVYLASDAAAFVDACNTALREPAHLVNERQQAVLEQTWSRRVDQIVEIMDAIQPHHAWADR